MEIERGVIVAGPPERAFALVDDLAVYPSWMDLIHEVVSDDDSSAAWNVELRARVGPLARSKKLRMVRILHDVPHVVVFERSEVDGRHHSPWVLRVHLSPTGSGDDVTVTMTLSYGGSLWAGAVLQRVLDEHVERGAAALRSLLDGAAC